VRNTLPPTLSKIAFFHFSILLQSLLHTPHHHLAKQIKQKQSEKGHTEEIDLVVPVFSIEILVYKFAVFFE